MKLVQSGSKVRLRQSQERHAELFAIVALDLLAY